MLSSTPTKVSFSSRFYSPTFTDPVPDLTQQRPITIDYATLLDDIVKFVLDHSQQVSPPLLETTQSQVKDNFGILKIRLVDTTGNYFDSHTRFMHEQMKPLFDSLLASLHDETIPLHIRINAVVEMSAKMTTCSGGISDGLNTALVQLQGSKHGLTGQLTIYKTEAINTAILQYAKRTNRYAPANEVHFANAYRARFAKEFGVKFPPDPLLKIGQAQIDEKQYHHCKSAVLAALDPITAAQWLAGEYLNAVRQSCMASGGNVVPKSEVDQFYVRFTESRIALELQFGVVSEHKILVLHYDETGQISQISLADSTILAVHFIDVLRQSDLVNAGDAVCLAQSDQGGKIMMLGSLFWRDQDGCCSEFMAIELVKYPPESVLKNLTRTNISEDFHGDILERMVQNMESEIKQGKKLDNADEWFHEMTTLIKKGVIPQKVVDAVLKLAICANHISGLQGLIQAEVRVNSGDASLRTMLMFAASTGNIESVKILLQAKVDINQQDSLGGTALVYAIYNQHDDVATLLIKQGANVNLGSFSGDTPAMVAAWFGCVGAMDALIGAKFDARIKNGKGQNVLSFAIQNKQAKVVEQLLRYDPALGRLIDREFNTYLHMTAQLGDVQTMKNLLHFCPAIDINAQNIKGYTPLMTAVAHGHIEASRLLINHHANILLQQADGRTAFMIAIQKGHLEVARLLADKLKNNVARPTNPLIAAACFAVFRGDIAMVRMLFELDPNLNMHHAVRPTVWMTAVGKRDLTMLFTLFELGAHNDIDTKNGNGTTALMMAVNQRSSAMTTALLKYWAKPDIQDSTGLTALMHAVKGNKIDLVRILTQQGKDTSMYPDLVNILIQHHADINEQSDLVRILIQGGADINVQDNDGNTALMLAVKEQNEPVIRLLVDGGANTFIQNYHGQSATSMLEERKMPLQWIQKSSTNKRIRLSGSENK